MPVVNGVFNVLIGSQHAAVPRQINHQDYLTSPGGAPVDAAVQMVLKLYDVGVRPGFRHRGARPLCCLAAAPK